MSFTFLAKSLAYSWKMSFAGQVLWKRREVVWARETAGAATAPAVPAATAACRRKRRRGGSLVSLMGAVSVLMMSCVNPGLWSRPSLPAIRGSQQTRQCRIDSKGFRIAFPEALPVSARRDDITAAVAGHQVVVVSGETGSGKTTQLPKIALAMGRGAGRRAGGGLIGHTQPRRIAASSVARRIAEELETPLGEVVGYRIRFQDRLSAGTRVKIMTDGILLAETQSDPLLRAYDTLIVDEAHERTLNIDFLLGHLRQILPRRPDLKVIVTSATIDTERFARHFAGPDGPAPILHVSGRLYPVEIRWRPFEEARDHDLADAIGDAVDELWTAGSGDILVFLPGEREIRDVQKRLSGRHPPGVEVLPLFARLGPAEQERIFAPHGARRIVLATNVAETSLTVPGIRYVVDAGQARVKRYSYRTKVEQLPIEPVSQAAANQRAGRCGRVADGICIRLYGEDDFAKRPAFTDAEIMRSSLAGVILRMKSLGLGEVESFPFLEAPPRRAIADGHDLLAELGAVDERNGLTPIGAELAKLPLDPRVGRMVLEARERGALREVLVVASSLSVQDVRDRPLEQQEAADRAHAMFDHPSSEFLGTLALWNWLEASRGGSGGSPKLSHRKQEQLLRERFLSPRRVREWRDVHAQLLTVATEHRWPVAAPSTTNVPPTSAEADRIHQSLLAGLLGNVGVKSEEDESFLGARGIRFHRHPAAHLSKKPGPWVVAAELVETTRLYARGMATIDARWLPALAGHLLKREVGEPFWDARTGRVLAHERAMLYGLVVYSGRRVDYAAIDTAVAREVFIRRALVEGEWATDLPFAKANRQAIAAVRELEHKSRRQDVLVDDAFLFAFHDAHVPRDVHDVAAFERWYRAASRADPSVLQLTREALMRHEAAGVTTEAFPLLVRLGGVDCKATYLHAPGDPRDGMTATLPLEALNAASTERCDWLVPGMLKDKVAALAKTLPQRPRARLAPLPGYAEGFAARVEASGRFGEGSLLEAIAADVRETTSLPVRASDFRPDALPPHLSMNILVVDAHGRRLGESRRLGELKAELGGQARSAFQALAALKPSVATSPAKEADVPPRRDPRQPAPTAAAERLVAWTFGPLPELLEVKRGKLALVGFPALVDRGDHATLEVFDEPEVAREQHRAGLRRLVALQVKDSLRNLEKNLPDLRPRRSRSCHWAARTSSCGSCSMRRSTGPSWPSPGPPPKKSSRPA
jgi:ATP-dependent helicase HrpA